MSKMQTAVMTTINLDNEETMEDIIKAEEMEEEEDFEEADFTEAALVKEEPKFEWYSLKFN
jgi:hypothetical protein